MACFYPLSAWQTDSGEIVFSERGKISRALNLPCGQCVGCRLERSRVWAVRVMHEATMHDQSYFVTLTYNDEHLPSPPTLIYRHFQLFMKSLRKAVGKPLRFYMCGEYGEEGYRPHFHACIFGLPLCDLCLFSESNDIKLYTSKFLDSIWKRGFVTVGSVTFESAAYVSRYVMKKRTGSQAEEFYTRVDVNTGEVYCLEPEFNRMSLKPGIGAPWIEKFGGDVFNYDHIVINGRTMRPGRFYDKYREKVDPDGFYAVQHERYLKSLTLGDDYSPDRLHARAVVAAAGLNFKKRTIL